MTPDDVGQAQPASEVMVIFQLAVATGYEVITTASRQNFDYVRRLGASQAFDRNFEFVAFRCGWQKLTFTGLNSSITLANHGLAIGPDSLSYTFFIHSSFP